MKRIPQKGELVIATIKKIYNYGAFCTLDEYEGLEAFLHVSEIAPRWIKNIHEHIREGQKVIAKVHRLIPEKNQIDLTIKRVSESDKVWKREQYRKSNRAKKMLEIAAKKLRRSREKFIEDVSAMLEKEYGSPYAGLEAISLNTKDAEKKLKLPKKTFSALESIAKDNIKKQKVKISREIKLECYDKDGVQTIKDALGSISSKLKVKITYLGAPYYRIEIEADDYKTAERELERIMGDIEQKLEKKEHVLEISEE